MTNIVNHILGQVESARHELEQYPPDSLCWPTRCVKAVEDNVPWLIASAPQVARNINAVLSSPAKLRRAWDDLKREVSLPEDLALAVDINLSLEQVLLASPSGAMISKLIEAELVKAAPTGNTHTNSASDYPDLFFTDHDYAGLPAHVRGDVKYGAALKGGRPVRIPDGLEIKTVKVGSGIDCHFPHVGLHYILQYSANSTPMRVTDIRLGFARRTTYRISQRNTEATTVKASFSRSAILSDAFVSILSDLLM